MRVLVTGGSGFIGKWVCQELRAQGHQPWAMDIADHPWQDVRDPEAVKETMRGKDAVIHLAAILGTSETVDEPIPVAETNLIGSLNVLERAAAWKIPVVYAAVGNAWMREEGTGAYTITKTAVEDFIRMYNQWRGCRFSVVRPVNAYGPLQSVHESLGGKSRVRKIIPTFINQALQGKPVEVYGDGSQISDCVWVGDVAKTFVAAIDRPGTWGVGPTQSCTVLEIAQVVQQIVMRHTKGAINPPLLHLPMRPGETPGVTRTTDPLLVENLLPLWDGIRRTVEFYAR